MAKTKMKKTKVKVKTEAVPVPARAVPQSHARTQSVNGTRLERGPALIQAHGRLRISAVRSNAGREVLARLDDPVFLPRKLMLIGLGPVETEKSGDGGRHYRTAAGLIIGSSVQRNGHLDVRDCFRRASDHASAVIESDAESSGFMPLPLRFQPAQVRAWWECECGARWRDRHKILAAWFPWKIPVRPSRGPCMYELRGWSRPTGAPLSEEVLEKFLAQPCWEVTEQAVKQQKAADLEVTKTKDVKSKPGKQKKDEKPKAGKKKKHKAAPEQAAAEQKAAKRKPVPAREVPARAAVAKATEPPVPEPKVAPLKTLVKVTLPEAQSADHNHESDLTFLSD